MYSGHFLVIHQKLLEVIIRLFYNFGQFFGLNSHCVLLWDNSFDVSFEEHLGWRQNATKVAAPVEFSTMFLWPARPWELEKENESKWEIESNEEEVTRLKELSNWYDILLRDLDFLENLVKRIDGKVNEGAGVQMKEVGFLNLNSKDASYPSICLSVNHSF